MSYQEASVGSLIIEKREERERERRESGIEKESEKKKKERSDGGIKSVTRRGVNVSFSSFSWIR